MSIEYIRKKQYRKNTGITLIALLITIIIMLILVAVTLSLTLGERGIIKKAQEAKEAQKVSEYSERIELSRGNVAIDNLGKVNIDDFIDQIYKDKIVPQGNITKIDDEKAKVTTEEGYEFIITADKIEYIGKGTGGNQGGSGGGDEGEDVETPPKNLQEGDIVITINPETWTNGNVSVTITNNIQGNFTLQYSFNQTNWIEYKGVFEVEENTTIYASVKNTKGEMSGVASINITKIDKQKPEITSAESTTNSVEIKAIDEGSGIVGYALTTENIAPTNYLNCTNSKNITIPINSLTQNVTYYAWVKDAVGNVSKPRQIATKQVAVSEGNITFEYVPTGWTNGIITITGSSNVAGYVVQLSTDGTFPNTATEVKTITVSQNQTIYARIVDSNNQANGMASREITKIDKDKPVITEAVAGTNSIQIKATDGASGIIGYKVTTSNTQPTSFDECVNAKALDVTVDGLEQGTTYYVWVKDEAGNVSEAKQTATKQLVTGIELSETDISLNVGETKTITATVIPSNADNKNVTWISSDTSVATVENGTITAIESGTATITIEATDGSGTKEEITVTVKQVTIEDLTLGEYIAYDSGNAEIGDNGTILCRVLYPKSSTYGLQLVTDEGLFECTLYGKGGIVGAPTALDNVAKGYYNEEYALDTRCAGTSPVNSDGLFTEKFTYTKNSTWGVYAISYNASYDSNASRDESYLPEGSGRRCWLVNFHLRYSGTNACYSSISCSESLNNSFSAELYRYNKARRPPDESKSNTYAVRGIMLMRDDIAIDGGAGTKENPYKLRKVE